MASVVVASRSFSKHPILRGEVLNRYPDAKFNDDDLILKGDTLVQFLRGHDKAITALETIDESILSQLPDLNIIGKYGVGLDMIDLHAMKKFGVKLGWTGGVNKRSVSELVISFAIALLHRTVFANAEVKKGEWYQVKGRQLSDCTVGIVGCGHVGKDLVRLLKPFNCKILAYDILDFKGFYNEKSVTPVGIEELIQKSDIVKEQIELEEARFFKTIESGIALFNMELENTEEIFSGEVAFKLYDTYGFPLDLTEDMLREKNLGLDSAKFEALMNEQRTRAKAAWKGSGDDAVHGDFKELLEEFGTNEFVGYETMHHASKVLALLDENYKRVDALDIGENGWVLLDKTPFYAQSGGQCGDIGALQCRAKVVDTRKFFDMNLSQISVTSSIKVGINVDAIVDISRNEITKHHSATHLLHAVLFDELGEHIAQAGSLVEATRLRFDFSHPKALSVEELMEIEKRVNVEIMRAIPAQTDVLPIEEAKKSGAKSQFGEKYGDEVRVVKFADTSIEFCGGVHVENTANIGNFIITKESGVSAGVRRIEAVCGNAAYNYFVAQRALLHQVESEVKNLDVIAGITRLKSTINGLKTELKEAQASAKVELKAEDVNGVAVVVEELANGDIKEKIDELKNQNEKLCAMLFQVKGDKVLIAAGVKGCDAKAGDWIKKIAPILGGGGGGRPDFAQAGGKDASKLPEAKELSLAFIKEVLL